jgi:micrococcal nuclease
LRDLHFHLRKSEKRSIPIPFIFLVGVLLFPSCSFAWTGKVVGISDGDTITVLTPDKTPVKIRLYGIDCPEGGQAFGTRAKQITSDVCFGKTVEVGNVDMDRYGRTVGLVTLNDGEVLNEELVGAGFAWLYGTYCKREICSDWKILEEQARDDGLGLWKDKNPMPPWEWRRMEREGKVKSDPCWKNVLRKRA